MHLTLHGNIEDEEFQRLLFEVERDQQNIWEELKKSTDQMNLYSFICFWYELETHWIQTYYAWMKDEIKEEMERKCKHYYKKMSGNPSAPLHHFFEILKLHHLPTSNVRSILRKMNTIRRYVFMNGVRLGKLVGEPVLRRHEAQALRLIRKDIVDRFINYRSEVAMKVPTT